MHPPLISYSDFAQNSISFPDQVSFSHKVSSKLPIPLYIYVQILYIYLYISLIL